MSDKRNEVRSLITEFNAERNTSGRYGIVQSYNPNTNTATVLLSSPESDAVGDIITNVLCPVTLGVQTVAPEPGRPCWVVFKGQRNEKRALISHYFNHNFQKYDYAKMYNAEASVPRFKLGM